MQAVGTGQIRMLKTCVAAAAAMACILAMLATLPAGSLAKGGSGCANADRPVTSLTREAARDAIICLFNRKRSAQNVVENGKLQKAAQRHTNTMRQKECFKHECPGEPSFEERVGSTGYCEAVGCSAAEIIAIRGAVATPRDVVSDWFDSGSHREIIRRASYEDVGVGINSNGFDVLFTAVFGRN